MRLRTRLWSRLLIAPAAFTGYLVSVAFASSSASGLSLVAQRTGIEFVTQSGSTATFPGYLQTGDRILARDALLEDGRVVGYDNEICTTTFDDNDLCQVSMVLTGKGQLQASWLWVGRNSSPYGPPQFSGTIDGGTGAYAHVRGQFDATVLSTGALRITAALR